VTALSDGALAAACGGSAMGRPGLSAPTHPTAAAQPPRGAEAATVGAN